MQQGAALVEHVTENIFPGGILLKKEINMLLISILAR